MPFSLELVKALTQPIFSKVEGYRLSHQARNREALKETSYVYGETLAEPFFELLQRLGLPPGACFMDLGAGVGRALLYATLFLDLKRAVGIELLPDLVDAARATTAELSAALVRDGHPQALDSVEWILGSFIDVDLSPADVLYIVNAVYEDSLMAALTPKFSALKPGTWVVSVGQPISSERLICEAKYLPYPTDWGDSFAFLYRAS